MTHSQITKLNSQIVADFILLKNQHSTQLFRKSDIFLGGEDFLLLFNNSIEKYIFFLGKNNFQIVNVEYSDKNILILGQNSLRYKKETKYLINLNSMKYIKGAYPRLTPIAYRSNNNLFMQYSFRKFLNISLSTMKVVEFDKWSFSPIEQGYIFSNNKKKLIVLSKEIKDRNLIKMLITHQEKRR